jgi:hypothetical protein
MKYYSLPQAYSLPISCRHDTLQYLEREYLVSLFILGKDNPNKNWEELFKNGTDAKEDPGLYPSMDEILVKFDVTRKKTLGVIDPMTEVDMEGESHTTQELKEIFPTIAACWMMSGAYLNFSSCKSSSRAL